MHDSRKNLADGDAIDAHGSEPPGLVRKLWIGEGSDFRDHLLRLDPDSRRFRFGSPVNAYFIDQYASRAIAPDSIVHGMFIDGTLRAVSELRPFGRPFPLDAEAALSVERPWQDRGVGSALLERTILAARKKTSRFTALPRRRCRRRGRESGAYTALAAARIHCRRSWDGDSDPRSPDPHDPPRVRETADRFRLRRESLGVFRQKIRT
jgi:GNAT superfamily N-acetyltransferase